MSEVGSSQFVTAWPVPKFRFEANWDAVVMSFQEVSGLDVESQRLDDRHGDSPSFSVIRMPGIKKYNEVTMKRGVFLSDNNVWDWFNEIKSHTIKRKPVTIRLLDEAGAPTMVWTLANAWPTRMTGFDLNATRNAVAVETIVFAHEGLTIANA